MKSNGEVLFSVIGVVLFSILFAGSLVLSNGVQNSSGAEELAQQFISDENVTEVTAGQILTFLENGFLYVGIVSLICAVIGVISIVLIKKSDNPGAAGKLLISTAILSTILTLFVGVLACCAYLIAGIKANGRNKSLKASA